MTFEELTKGPVVLRSVPMVWHRTVSAMMNDLRSRVMLKMIRQAHEAELKEPGELPTSSIVGVPEW